jgi:hypothetical protein
MQKRIVLDVRILESAAVVQQHDNGRDKTDVIETRPPEGRQNQSILKGHAHLFMPTKSTTVGRRIATCAGAQPRLNVTFLMYLIYNNNGKID